MILFLAVGTLVTQSAIGQVVFRVLEPAPVQGFYELSHTSGTWGGNLNIAANAVQQFAVLGDDGTAADSLGCGNYVNGAAVNGKIAVIYRGTCEFGTKAKKAQDAGAVAVVVINNASGVIAMGVGTSGDGAGVTIPVVMISQETGALIRPALLAGTLKLFIGTKVGLFPNDLGITKHDIIRPGSFATPALIAQDTSEYKVLLGGKIRNFGNTAQSNATLTAKITLNGSEIYNQSGSVGSLAVNDSTDIRLPDFFIPNNNVAKYVLTYSVSSSSGADGDPTDNTISQDFHITNSVYSKSRYDFTANKPISTGGITSGDAPAKATTWGVLMYAPKASRIRVTGVQFAASTRQGSNESLQGELIKGTVFDWDDANQDGRINLGELVELGTDFYSYATDAQGEFVTLNFTNAIPLTDDRVYYISIAYEGVTKTVFYGSDDQTLYSYSITPYQQYFNPVVLNADQQDQIAYEAGFTSGATPALGVFTESNSNSSVSENELNLNLSVYPNPAKDVVNVTFGNVVSNAKVQLNVIDVTGRAVASQQYNITNGQNYVSINTADMANGTYFFKVSVNGQTVKSLPVVIAK